MGTHKHITGSVTDVAAELVRRRIQYATRIAGRFEFVLPDGRSLARGSGIAGDRRWFWADTGQTATWKEIKNGN